MKKLIKILIVVCLISVPAVKLKAQIDDTDQVIDYEEEEVPFDGGLSLLLAAGIGLGARKNYKNRQQKQQDVH